MTCIRRAWLTLDTRRVDLEDVAGGQWVCTELDMPLPEVRDVVNNRPQMDGIDDRTAYYGARQISASIVTTNSTLLPDTVAGMFAPFMVPSARPVLHYVLDRGANSPERVITVRAAEMTWPITGSRRRDIHLQWVANDPVARDPNPTTVTAWSGSSTTPGRTYNLTFNRVYPPGGGAAAPGFINVVGDVPARPLLRVYGPVTAPWVTVSTLTGLPTIQFVVYFRPGYVIGAGQWVDVDTNAKTVYKNSDPAQPDPGALDWVNVTWPVLTAGRTWRMSLSGSSTSSVTQVQAIWQEGYLT